MSGIHIGGNSGAVNFAQDQATATQDARTITTYNIPQTIQDEVSRSVPLNEQEDVLMMIKELREELDHDEPDTGLITQVLRKVRDISPDVIEVVSTAFVNPLAAAGIALDKILDE